LSPNDFKSKNVGYRTSHVLGDKFSDNRKGLNQWLNTNQEKDEGDSTIGGFY